MIKQLQVGRRSVRMTDYSFEAVLIRPEGVGTWTYLNVPRAVSENFGTKGQVKVKGTVNGYPYRSTLMPHGDGSHYLVVGKPIRDQIHAAQGDIVQVTIEKDATARQIDVPEDLEKALSLSPTAREVFDRLAYSHRKEYIQWISSAKQSSTRQRRIEKTLEMLSQGKKLRG